MNLDIKAVKKCQELKAVRSELLNDRLRVQSRGGDILPIQSRLAAIALDLRAYNGAILKSLDVL